LEKGGADQSRIHLGGTARSPEDAAALFEMGLQFAEIPIPHPERFASSISEYRRLMERSDRYYLCHGPREGDPNDCRSLENIYLPKLVKILAIMPELKMRILTIHFWLDPRYVKPDVIVYKVGFLKRVLRTAGDSGIRICLENMSENATHLSPVFEALPTLNMTLDLGHAQLLTTQNTSFGFMQSFPERIRHIHLHDNRGGNTPADDLHLPVGKGIIDFDGIFKNLACIRYHRTITLELKPLEIQGNLAAVKERLAHAGLTLQDTDEGVIHDD